MYQKITSIPPKLIDELKDVLYHSPNLEMTAVTK
jgi:hypothetical protein